MMYMINPKKVWKQQKLFTKLVLSRMYSVSPKGRDQYFLRVLLSHVKDLKFNTLQDTPKFHAIFNINDFVTGIHYACAIPPLIFYLSNRKKARNKIPSRKPKNFTHVSIFLTVHKI